MITYIDFINRLEELNIKLYDFQKRISYSRLSNLQTEKIVQIGGGFNNSIIYKLDKVELENIILKLLAKDYEQADVLCKHFCKKT
jgi:hypothetical protein